MIESGFSLAADFRPVTYAEWRVRVEREMGADAGEPRLVRRTHEGFDLEPLYTREHVHAEGRPGFPGLPPFIRGGTPLGNAVSGWDIRQEHAHADLAATRRAIWSDLEGGARSIRIRLDAAGRAGLDPDSPAAVERAGLDGVMTYAAADLDEVLDGVSLDACAVALDAGAAFLPGAASLVAVWARRGVPRERLRGSFEADPLGVLAREGSLPLPLGRALELLADLAAWTSTHLPDVHAVRVDTSPYHDAGAPAEVDLACSMATAIEYLRALTAAGLDLNDAARQISFGYSLGCRFFLAAAKLRAARRLWSHVIEASGGDPEAGAARLEVRPGRRVLTARDPWVNILRNVACCFAGALGGADTITAVPFDAAIGLPDESSRRLARNTQLILQHESQLHRVIDPAGGSWMVESLTATLASRAWSLVREIERRGGMTAVLRDGWLAGRVRDGFRPRLEALLRGAERITGVSAFPDLSEPRLERERPDRVGLLAAARTRVQSRRAPMRHRALNHLATCVASSDHRPGSITAAAVEAAEAGASLGEIAERLSFGRNPVTVERFEPRILEQVAAQEDAP